MTADEKGGLLKGVAAAYLLNTGISFLLFNSVFLSILTPLPQIFSHIRMGRWAGFSMPLILLAAASASGFGTGLSYFLQFALPGMILSEAIVRGFSVEKGFAAAVGLPTAAALIVITLLASDRGTTSREVVKEFFQKTVSRSIDLQKEGGSDKEAIREIEKLAPVVIDFIARIHHALIAIGITTTLWLNTLLLTVLMRQKGLPLPFGELSKWKAPEHLVWAVVAGGGMLLLGNESITAAGAGILLVLFVIYFFQGMAIISFYFRKKGVSAPLKAMGYLFIIWYLGILVAIMGLFDLWADFRRLSAPKENGA